MRHSFKMMSIAAYLGMALFALPAGALCATLFYDNFEPPLSQGVWTIGPDDWRQDHHDSLASQNNHIRTPGVNGLRSWISWRDAWNSQHQLGASYPGDVYLKFWMFEDNNIPWPYPLIPGHSDEEWPNGYGTLLNSAWLVDPESAGADAYMIGVMGEIGRTSGKLRDYFDNSCIYTTTDYYQALNGDGVGLSKRRQGWRKYTILVHGYTGNPGDVEFFVDDKLVYEGIRKPAVAGGGGAPVETIVLGARWWTYETYYYDQVEFGGIEPTESCATVEEALSLPDGTWVSLNPKTVSGSFTKAPFPGHFTVQEDDRSAALWVSSSYPAQVSPSTNQGESVQVDGIVRTNEAGMRFVDAIKVTQSAAAADQARVVGMRLTSLGSRLTDGRLVKVWGRVVNVPGSSPATVRGQERSGDWRRYFLIDDGSGGAPVKCYYDNIISGIDPVPVVSSGNFVSVVGVAGREVLVPGTTAPEKSVWIRGAGDLRILSN